MKASKSLLTRATAIFNKWIRERDKNTGCISCVTGGIENAGHYYHGHLYSAVRFNEINVNGQCVHCNLSKAGSGESYRKNMIKKWGEQKVFLLDSAARQRKTWQDFEVKQIIKLYTL